MISTLDDQRYPGNPLPVLAAGYLGPGLVPGQDAAWREADLPLAPDELVQTLMGQPMRRAGRFIKLVCCGALVCLKSVPAERLREKKIGIFLATGLGNVDEILPFITQVFKHDGGFPSPNQFANSVSNAAAFYLARVCEVKGVVLTVSQEELSFESALWLAESYLAAGELDLALVGGCDVFTPTIEDYRERLNLSPANHRPVAMGEGSSWLLLGTAGEEKIGDILSIDLDGQLQLPEDAASDAQFALCEELAAQFLPPGGKSSASRVFLPGFRLRGIDAGHWSKRGWAVDDYLPHCGISSTASAYGLARALLLRKHALIVHANHHATGRPALVAAMTK